LSPVGGRALRSGRLDADVDNVVGGDVDGRLKVTCRGCPRCGGGGARTGGACATGRPLRGGLDGSVSAGVLAALRRSLDTLSVLSPIFKRKNVLTVPALGKVRRRLGTAAAARRPGGPEQSGPAATPPVDGAGAECHPWKVVVPVGGGGPGPQGVLQPPVEPIGLRMVGGCG
jgi:hypothetical protein